MPWMVHTVVCLIVYTFLKFFSSVAYFAMGDAVSAAGNIIGAVITICK
jgi:hypothetical protein